MATTFVFHRVKDFGAWREAYDSVSVADMQKEGGVMADAVYRAEADPSNVLVMHQFSTMGEAHRFFDDPKLREAMGRAGVDPQSLRIEFFEEA